VKKPLNILLILLALLLLSLGTLWFWPSSEPEYNGHPVSWWFDKIGPPPPVAGTYTGRYYLSRETEAAFLSLGKSSLSFLLATVQQTESFPTKKKILNFVASACHIPLRQRFPIEEREKALWLLTKLGPQAEEAVPALIGLLRQSKDSEWRSGVIRVLSAMGQHAHAALPALLEAANDPRDYNRSAVAAALPQIARNADEILPCLERLLSDPSWPVCESAASSLSTMNRLPKRAVPGLLTLLARQDRSSQPPMLRALYQADPEVTFQHFLSRWHNPDPKTRANALHVLSQFEDRHGIALSCCVESIGDKDLLVRSAALQGIFLFGYRNQEAIGALMTAAVTADDLEKARMLRVLKAIDSQASDTFQPTRRR
jgi:HEAT repeat protein